jgi:flagellar hook-associated protein 3 FlgL
MRLSTANAFDTGIDTLVNRQADLTDSQARLASGKRIMKASDDPAGAARAEHALAGILRSDTSQRSVDASRIAISQTEAALGDASTLLQQARELMVSAGNPSYTDSERSAVAAQLKSVRDQLVDIANRSDGAGTYLFGGQGATQKPFLDAPGGVQFVATAGTALTDSTSALPLTSDGSASWMTARTGNGSFVTSAGAGVTTAQIDNGQVTTPSLLTGASYDIQFTVAAGVTTYAVLMNGAATAVTAAPYVSGQSITVDGMTFSISGAPVNGDQFQIGPSTPTLTVFDALDKTIADLGKVAQTGWQRAQDNADNLRDIDSAMGTMQSTRSLAGAMLNRVDTETDRLASQKLTSETVRSDAEDLDMVSALSTFQTKQSGYDAALKSYAMVQRLSLFQYLGG